MIYHQETLPYYEFSRLAAIPNIQHYISTRAGGVSMDDFRSLNISLGTADDRENILENRVRIATMLQIPMEHLLFPKQIHSAQIKVISAQDLMLAQDDLEEYLEGSDSLITQQANICISVIAADCVPILYFDPTTNTIGASHGGWRGTVKKIAQKTVLAMQKSFGCKPEDLLIGIGPSIGPESYEVGPEVIEAFVEAFGSKEQLVKNETAAGKGHLNLWQANIQQLEEVGVRASQIECAALCTYQHHDVFFSARRLGGKGGRFAAGIMLKESYPDEALPHLNIW